MELVSAKGESMIVLVEQRVGSTNNKIVQEKGFIYFAVWSGFWMPPLTRPDVDAHKHELLFFSIKNENDILI